MNLRNPFTDMSRSVMATALLVLAASCSGCALFGATLRSDAVDSQVVDADTGQPIEGAVVVAYWEMHRGSFAGGGLPCGAANVEEAVTDQDGKFRIPGWGPIHSSCDGMRSGAPFLYVFKSGYGDTRVSNYPLEPPVVTFTRSEWNDKPIKLAKYPDLNLGEVGIKSYAAAFGGLNDELEYFIVDLPTECNWRKIPNMLRALMAQVKLFRAAGNRLGSIADELSTNDAFLQHVAPKCGSPKAFIEGLEKGN